MWTLAFSRTGVNSTSQSFMTVRRLRTFSANNAVTVIYTSLCLALWESHFIQESSNAFSYVSEPEDKVGFATWCCCLCVSRWCWMWMSGSTCLMEMSCASVQALRGLSGLSCWRSRGIKARRSQKGERVYTAERNTSPHITDTSTIASIWLLLF